MPTAASLVIAERSMATKRSRLSPAPTPRGRCARCVSPMRSGRRSQRARAISPGRTGIGQRAANSRLLRAEVVQDERRVDAGPRRRCRGWSRGRSRARRRRRAPPRGSPRARRSRPAGGRRGAGRAAVPRSSAPARHCRCSSVSGDVGDLSPRRQLVALVGRDLLAAPGQQRRDDAEQRGRGGA